MHGETEDPDNGPTGRAAEDEAARRLLRHAEDSPLAYVEFDGALTVTRWSRGAARMFGWSPLETLGCNLVEWKFVHPEDAPAVEAEVLEMHRRGGRRGIVHTNRNFTRDGSVIECEWYSTSLHDPAGNLVSILSLARDVTARSAEMRLLKENEERFRAMVDAMPHIAWTVNALGNISSWNRKWVEYTGVEPFTEHDPDGTSAIHPADYPPLLKAWLAATEAASVFEIETRVRRFDNVYRWHLLRAAPVVGAEGAIVSWFGTATDTQDRRRTETDTRFLIELGTELSEPGTELHLSERACSATAVHFGADRCSLCLVDLDTDTLTRVAVYPTEPATPSGPHPLSAFPPESVAKARQGLVLAMGDAATELALGSEPHVRDLFARLGVAALLTVPIVREGRLLAAFTLIQRTPRDWDRDDMALAERVAARLWNAVESARGRQTLMRAAERLKLLEDATDIVWSAGAADDRLWDTEGSAGWRAYTGQTSDQAANPGWMEAVHPDDRDGCRRAWIAAVESDVTYNHTCRIRRADGEWRVMVERAVPLRDDDGKATEWVGVSNDITDKIRHEETIHASEERYRLVFQATSDLLADYDLRSGTIVWTNVLSTVYGYPKECLKSGLEFWRRLIHPDDRERVEAELADTIARRCGTFASSYRFAAFSGEFRDLRARATIVYDDDGSPRRIVCSKADVTEQTVADRRMAEARDMAEQANAAKSSFLAGMSHELRTPLASILLTCEMLHEDAVAVGDTERIRDLQRVVGAGTHLRSVIDNILDIAKIEAGRMTVHAEEFDLADAISEAVETVRPIVAAGNNRIMVEQATSPGKVVLDRAKVRQCVINLLSNANKFTDDGVIAVDAWRERSEGSEPPHVVIQVRDNGSGIEAQLMPRLFQEFVQGDPVVSRRYGGTGLGLALCRRFAEMMDGTVAAESEPGQGAVFTIRLPAGAPGA